MFFLPEEGSHEPCKCSPGLSGGAHQFLIESVSFKIGRKYLFRRSQEDRMMLGLVTAALNSIEPQSEFVQKRILSVLSLENKTRVTKIQIHVPLLVLFVH